MLEFFRYDLKLLLNTGNTSAIILYIWYFETVIFLQLKVTWNNLGHFCIRLIKLILKQLSNTAGFNTQVWNRTSQHTGWIIPQPLTCNYHLLPPQVALNQLLASQVPIWKYKLLLGPHMLWGWEGGQKQELHACLDDFENVYFQHTAQEQFDKIKIPLCHHGYRYVFFK